MKIVKPCNCLDNVVCNYRIRALEENPSIVRKQFVPCTLATPFNILVGKEWPDLMSKLKSKTVIFAHNILNLFYLQHILKRLTGQ